MKLVVDTNVIFSGIFFQGAPNKVLVSLLRGDCKVVLTEEIILEYREVIKRYAFKKKIPNINEPLQIIDILISDSIMIDAKNIISPYCADLDDVKFLQAAIASNARYLISGDKHLLDVGSYIGGEVLQAHDFLQSQEVLV